MNHHHYLSNHENPQMMRMKKTSQTPNASTPLSNRGALQIQQEFFKINFKNSVSPFRGLE
jgi:hypothetical protein